MDVVKEINDKKLVEWHGEYKYWKLPGVSPNT
jgi:hypothetical protein